MKVLMINSVCGIRSTGRICTDLAEELEKQGHECKIAYGRETVPDKYKQYAIKIGNSLSVKIDALKTRIFDNAGFNSTLATKKFIKWVKEYDPDVIHLHNLHGYYINVKVLFDYLKKCGKKIIWTFHDCWPFTGHCTHFENVGCNKWQKRCYNCSQKKEYPKSMLFSNAKSNYYRKKQTFTNVPNLTIVTTSKWLTNLVNASFLNEYNSQEITNGIDVTAYKQKKGSFKQRYKLNGKKIVLGAASSWTKEKGLYDFYKLSKTLSEDFKVVLIGLTKQQLKSLPCEILGVERTNSIQELIEIYSEASVFVNPTYNDTYPTVNLEAQACGTPVVTYKTGGSPESVPNSNVIEKGNIEALRSRIIEVCENGSEIIKPTSKEEMLNNYVNLYKN